MIEEINIIDDEIYFEGVKVATLKPDLFGTVRDRFIQFLYIEGVEENIDDLEVNFEFSEGLKTKICEKFAKVVGETGSITLQQVNEIFNKWDDEK